VEHDGRHPVGIVELRVGSRPVLAALDAVLRARAAVEQALWRDADAPARTLAPTSS
jgi:hypothetical protein